MCWNCNNFPPGRPIDIVQAYLEQIHNSLFTLHVRPRPSSVDLRLRCATGRRSCRPDRCRRLRTSTAATLKVLAHCLMWLCLPDLPSAVISNNSVVYRSATCLRRPLPSHTAPPGSLASQRRSRRATHRICHPKAPIFYSFSRNPGSVSSSTIRTRYAGYDRQAAAAFESLQASFGHDL